jgi:hypothetical protein
MFIFGNNHTVSPSIAVDFSLARMADLAAHFPSFVWLKVIPRKLTPDMGPKVLSVLNEANNGLAGSISWTVCCRLANRNLERARIRFGRMKGLRNTKEGKLL